MANKKITITYPIPVALIVFLAFFVAKIFDKIDWSWWWVFSPFWIPFALLIIIAIIVGIIYLLLLGIESVIKLCK